MAPFDLLPIHLLSVDDTGVFTFDGPVKTNAGGVETGVVAVVGGSCPEFPGGFDQAVISVVDWGLPPPVAGEPWTLTQPLVVLTASSPTAEIVAGSGLFVPP